MALRDQMSDTGKNADTSELKLLRDFGGFIDLRARTTADEKRFDPNAPGSAGDLRHLTGSGMEPAEPGEDDTPYWKPVG